MRSSDSEAKSPMVSIIYVHWNCFDFLVNSIQSVIAHTRINFEIIVIDNHSNLNDQRLRDRFPDLGEKLVIHLNPSNAGFSKAMNQGISLSKGDFLLWLNCDTLIQEDVIGLTYRESEKWNHQAAIGVRHVNVDGTYQASAHPFPDLWKNTFGLFYHQSPAPEIRLTESMGVDWVCGSYLFLPREMSDRVGKIDEQFFTYDEDIDYCWRIKKSGYKILYSPCAKIIHYGSATGPFIDDKTRMNLQSRYLFFKKNKGRLLSRVFYLAAFIKLLAGIVFYPLKPDLRKKIDRLGSWIRYGLGGH